MTSADKIRSKVFGALDGVLPSASSSSYPSPTPANISTTTKSQTPSPPRADSPSDAGLSINIPRPPSLNVTPMPSTKSPRTAGSENGKEAKPAHANPQMPQLTVNGHGPTHTFGALNSPRAATNGTKEKDYANSEREEVATAREKYRAKLGIEYKSVEHARLQEDEAKEVYWKRWGPYLSERQWVRHHRRPALFDAHVC
jgi:hypothetical protein